jgi:hypothetical protein
MRGSLMVMACVASNSILCFSCSQVVYKHQDFLASLKTKADVTRNFGDPNEYKLQGDSTTWLYDLSGQRSRNPLNLRTSGISNSSGQGQQVEAFYFPRKALLITFRNDSVINYRSNGVDYSRRKAQPLRTGLAVLGGMGIALGMMTLYYNTFLR